MLVSDQFLTWSDEKYLDAYTAAEGGVVAMTRSFAAGMSREGVRVNAICPGFVATEPQLEWLKDANAQAIMRMLHLLPVATPELCAIPG